jgi:serine/threonine-protein kinase
MLRQARGSDAPSPAYLEALLAYYEGHLDEALDRLKDMEDHRPWFYEAPLLRGSLLQARAWNRWNAGDREGAKADFDAGRRELTAAAASGRSAPDVQVAMADLELNAFYMEKYGQGQVQPIFERGMAALKVALEAQPDHVPALIHQSALLGEMAAFEVLQGRDGQALAQRAVTTAEAAVAAEPSRAEAWIAVGRTCYQWANARAGRSLDPTEPIEKGLRAFDPLSPDKRDYTVWNTLGTLHVAWANYQIAQGQEASAELGRAIAAFKTATGMEPHLLNAFINLGTCLRERAELPHARDPEGDLQAASCALETARTLNPQHFVPCFVLGQVRYAQALRTRARGGDPRPELTSSLESFKQGLLINPGIPQLHLGVGIAASELARTAWEEGADPSAWVSQSRAAYTRAIEAAPDQYFGFVDLAYLLTWEAKTRCYAPALGEADAVLRRGKRCIPETELWTNQGDILVVRARLALAAGADPGRSLAAGEAILTKALERLPGAKLALQYLGELREVRATWLVQQHRADAEVFEQAASTCRQAIAVAPDNQEPTLGLVRLLLARMAWERAEGRASVASLREAHAGLDPLLQARPHWGEALALRAALDLEEAEGLPPVQRRDKARKALQDLLTALGFNRNLAKDTRPLQTWAQRLVKGEA